MENYSENNYQEAVLGLVAPIGVDLDTIVAHLKSLIEQFGFEPIIIQISNLQEILNTNRLTSIDRIELDDRSIEMGKLRKENENSGIESEVFSLLFSKYLSQNRKYDKNKVYILDSLKRPEEIVCLKNIYGKSFYTIGVTSTYEDRIKQKTKETNDPKLAKKLVDEDFEKQFEPKNNFKNQTDKAFQLSDIFLNLNEENIDLVCSHLERFIDLIFGAPIVTPTLDEHNMFLAYMSSFRSADLSRQVGSAIINHHQDIVALGANDVPQYGGGHYWPDVPYKVYDENSKNHPNSFTDKRDYTLGMDKNSDEKSKIIKDIATTLIDKVSIDESELIKLLDSTKLADITEYGRAVHAEMSSLMSAARNGVSVNKATMYCTTYPCHNCAKHIVAAGLDKVFYIEPYPKSKAIELHSDAITDSDVSDNNKVKFEAFSGVGPKRYQDLFSMKLGDSRPIKRKNGSNSIAFMRKEVKMLRVPVSVNVTKLKEEEYLSQIPEIKTLAEISSVDIRKNSEIKFFLENEGYGVIKALSEHENDFFFRVRNLSDSSEKDSLMKGAKVNFEILKGEKKGVFFADDIKFDS